MLPTFVIVFRESLEAALIISIVMASSRGIAGRTRWVAAGLVAGLAGAGLLGLFADALSGLAGGVGNELFNAGVLLLAAMMLGWHHVWMSTHGAELAAQSRSISKAVREGMRPLSALALVTGIAVLREGSETVIFLYGIAVNTSGGAWTILQGGLSGALAAVLLGLLVYGGLLTVPIRHIFKVTGILLMLIAAGLAAQAASFLVQAGLVPPLGYDIWNTSHILSQDGTIGLLLHILVGYIARPLGIQIVFYVLTLVLILSATSIVRRQHVRASAQTAA